MGIITALLTAAYMGRAYWMTFWGEYRGHGTPHESPRVMTVPLIDPRRRLAAVRLPQLPGELLRAPAPEQRDARFEHFVEPKFAFPAIDHAGFMPWLALLSLALAVAGAIIGFAYYQNNVGPHGLTRRSRAARAGYAFLDNKYYLDALYNDVIVADTKGPLARAAYWFNQNVLDAIVNGVATRRPEGRGGRSTGTSTSWWSTESSTVRGWSRTSPASSSVASRPARSSSTRRCSSSGVTILAGIFVFVI